MFASQPNFSNCDLNKDIFIRVTMQISSRDFVLSIPKELLTDLSKCLMRRQYFNISLFITPNANRVAIVFHFKMPPPKLWSTLHTLNFTFPLRMPKRIPSLSPMWLCSMKCYFQLPIVMWLQSNLLALRWRWWTWQFRLWLEVGGRGQMCIAYRCQRQQQTFK